MDLDLKESTGRKAGEVIPGGGSKVGQHRWEDTHTGGRFWLNGEGANRVGAGGHELAARYQVSAERIRQLEQNAMKKLKQALLAA